jgi:hypothetical protein
MVLIYQSNFEKQYRAPCCSCSFLSALVVYLLAFTLPFAFVYQTDGLWVKHQTYYEQPNVRFRNELLLEVLFADGQSKQFSTVRSLNQMS